MIAALLGWTKLPQWALELLAIAAVAGGIWFWQHHLIGEGIAQQKAADDAATAVLMRDAADETAKLRIQALTAEQAHDKETADLKAAIDAHPNQPVRLCLNSNARGQGVSASGTAIPGATSAGPSTAGLQPLPDGDPASGPGRAGPDIEPMLTALGAAADKISAELREFQSR
jgi:hypothetical protein